MIARVASIAVIDGVDSVGAKAVVYDSAASNVSRILPNELSNDVSTSLCTLFDTEIALVDAAT